MYQVIRSLPLSSDSTKIILDFVGKSDTAKMIHKYFKYPLSRLDFDEWIFEEYTTTIICVNNKYYFNELSIVCQSGENHILEIDSLQHNRLDAVEWDSTEIVSSQYECISQNYPTFQEEYNYYESNGLGLFMEFNYHWDGITEFAYMNASLFD